MTVHEYQPGSWTALATGGAVALLHPSVAVEAARELWQVTSSGRRLGAWVEYLAGAGIASLPSFAMVETHDDGLRVLVRGEIEVTVGSQVVTGQGYATWREEVLPVTDEVTLSATRGDGEWLPITGGIVGAAMVRLAPSSAADGADRAGQHEAEDEEDVELTVARMPALAALAAGAPASDGDADAVPVVPAPATEQSAVVGPPAEAEAAVGETEPEPAVPEAAGSEAAPEPAAEAAAQDPELAGEDADDYDHLLWSTEQQQQQRTAQPALDGAAVTASPEPSGPSDPSATAEPATGATGAPESGDPETTRAPEPEPGDLPSTGDAAPQSQPATAAPAAPPPVIDSVPGRPRPAEQPAAGPAAPLAPAGAGEPGTPAPVGRPVDLPPPPGSAAPAERPGDELEEGDHDGETILAADLPATDVPTAEDPAVADAPAVELVLSNGPRIELTRPVLLGRAPEATRFVGTEAPRLVSVPNPERDVSGTHVEVRAVGDHVVVTDMRSTNGTVVTLPGQPAVRLQPGTGVPVTSGALIELGEGVSARVVTVEEQA